MRAREHGHYKLLDIRISLDHDLTIKQGHDITHLIRYEIQKQYSDVEEVLIHVKLYFENDTMYEYLDKIALKIRMLSISLI